jgi:predicted metal-dependent HD superfamily phosphohydrolase
MWSNFIGDNWMRHTVLQDRVKAQYDLNNLPYHNWQHILDCYAYLEENDVPYDKNLDYAVIFHDIVYDNLPEKEYRSTEQMLRSTPSTEAYDILMATRKHSIKDANWQSIAMIKADLHQLTIPDKTLENFSKILQESKKLYDIDTSLFIKENAKFLLELCATMTENYLIDDDVFWLEVKQGIYFTLNIGENLDNFVYSSNLYGPAVRNIT